MIIVVILVDRPDKKATQSSLVGKINLSLKRDLVIKGDPFVALTRPVRDVVHSCVFIVDRIQTILVQEGLDLPIRQDSC